MAKFFTTLGLSQGQVETKPGVWSECIKEVSCTGEVLRNSSRYDTPSNVNDDLTVGNQLSVLADPYAYENFHSIRWIDWMGSRWKVTSVEVNYPRLILSLGGVYHGDESGSETPETP